MARKTLVVLSSAVGIAAAAAGAYIARQRRDGHTTVGMPKAAAARIAEMPTQKPADAAQDEPVTSR